MKNKNEDAEILNEFLDNSETKKKALEKIIKGLDSTNEKNKQKLKH